MLKYNAKIYEGIVKSLIQNQAESGSLTYSRLYEKLVSLLGRPLSHRDYSAHLAQMKDKILYTFEVKDKKRSIYYGLTQNAMKLYQLRILGVAKEYEKRLSLYHLLLYFETFKRGQILTEKQLNKLLKKMGSSKNKLRQLHSPDFRNIKNTVRGYEDPVSEIEILELSAKESGTISTHPNYYVLKRGFSIPEFISYLGKIRNDKEPRPFSAYPILVPYVHFNEYSNSEIEEGVDLLEKANLLKAITLSMNKKKKRFRVANKELINLTQQ